MILETPASMRDGAGIVNLQGSHTQPARTDSATILLSDPRPLTRQCLAHALAAHWPEADVLPVPSLHELADVTEPHLFDLVILSLGPLCAASSGAMQEIERAHQCLSAPLAILSDVDDLRAAAAALRCGARAYISTATELPVLVGILNLVRAGGTYVPASFLARAPAPASNQASGDGGGALAPIVDTFTPKEIEILRRLKDGKPNKIIAYELDICESTVKVHMRHIMSKLNATNRTQAALLAQQILAEAEPV